MAHNGGRPTRPRHGPAGGSVGGRFEGCREAASGVVEGALDVRAGVVGRHGEQREVEGVSRGDVELLVRPMRTSTRGPRIAPAPPVRDPLDSGAACYSCAGIRPSAMASVKAV